MYVKESIACENKQQIVEFMKVTGPYFIVYQSYWLRELDSRFEFALCWGLPKCYATCEGPTAHITLTVVTFSFQIFCFSCHSADGCFWAISRKQPAIPPSWKVCGLCNTEYLYLLCFYWKTNLCGIGCIVVRFVNTTFG